MRVVSEEEYDQASVRSPADCPLLATGQPHPWSNVLIKCLGQMSWSNNVDLASPPTANSSCTGQSRFGRILVKMRVKLRPGAHTQRFDPVTAPSGEYSQTYSQARFIHWSHVAEKMVKQWPTTEQKAVIAPSSPLSAKPKSNTILHAAIRQSR